MARPITLGEAVALIAPSAGVEPDDVGGWAVVILTKQDTTRVVTGPRRGRESAEYLLGLGLEAVRHGNNVPPSERSDR